MKKINFKKVSPTDLLSIEELLKEYAKYCCVIFDCNEASGEVMAADMAEPYDAEFVLQEFEGSYTIGGVKYEVYSCYTDYTLCGWFDLANEEPFEFYMLIDKSTLMDDTVFSYRNASKKYIV